jgi:tyrosine-specific transport protein
MALSRGESAVIPLRHFLQNPNLLRLGEFFGFFALLTSLIGVGLGLMDFLADGLRIKKNQLGLFFLWGLIFGPALFISLTYPHLFLSALELAGGIGSALLLGLLPCLMVIQKRYFQNNRQFEELFGSKIALFLLISFILFELTIQFNIF